MKKINLLLLAVLCSVMLWGCEKEKDEPIIDPNPDITEVELLDDPTFATGFNLLGVSPVIDGRTVYRHLDYDGKAIPSDREVWYLGQWWTPYDVKNATYEEKDGNYIYETPSRKIEVNPSNNGYYRVDLLGSKEYDHPRQGGEPWPHNLIEQNFTQSVKIGEISRLVLTLDVSINSVVNMMGDAYNPDMHAAQFLWYVTVNNAVPQDSNPDEVGKPGDFFWFGIPIYDSRFDFINESKHIDQGAPGTTNKLIYSISSRNYINEKIQFGKIYHIEIDILPYLREAFIYAASNNALVNAKLENLVVNYMNLGWELPGTFDVSSTIQNLSIKAYMK
ncbi:MAG TPA: hypothetical protein VK005_02075 [Acholeplasma sp.]|nr:hypothetical protein [Acholeplasma sp.]